MIWTASPTINRNILEGKDLIRDKEDFIALQFARWRDTAFAYKPKVYSEGGRFGLQVEYMKLTSFVPFL